MCDERGGDERQVGSRGMKRRRQGLSSSKGQLGVFAMEELQKRTLIGIEAILHE